jgi:hypothetical protein
MSALPAPPALRNRRGEWARDLLLVLSCAVLLGGVLAAPALGLSSGNPGDDLTRNTVRVALVYYLFGAGMMLLLRPEEWRADTGRGRMARWGWTLAWACFLVHLAMAFHHYHHWSHAEAVAHVQRASGFGPGIFLSHIFTLVWTTDVAWWWLAPASYAARPRWIDLALHGFMVFMTFNATVVYETGPIRWAGLAMFVALAGVLAVRWRTRCRRPAPFPGVVS